MSAYAYARLRQISAFVVRTMNTFDCMEESNFFSDEDECASPSTNICHSDAICFNTPGSYSCACKPGFIGNGVNCTGMSRLQLEIFLEYVNITLVE